MFSQLALLRLVVNIMTADGDRQLRKAAGSRMPPEIAYKISECSDSSDSVASLSFADQEMHQVYQPLAKEMKEREMKERFLQKLREYVAFENGKPRHEPGAPYRRGRHTRNPWSFWLDENVATERKQERPKQRAARLFAKIPWSFWLVPDFARAARQAGVRGNIVLFSMVRRKARSDIAETAREIVEENDRMEHEDARVDLRWNLKQLRKFVTCIPIICWDKESDSTHFRRDFCLDQKDHPIHTCFEKWHKQLRKRYPWLEVANYLAGAAESANEEEDADNDDGDFTDSSQFGGASKEQQRHFAFTELDFLYFIFSSLFLKLMMNMRVIFSLFALGTKSMQQGYLSESNNYSFYMFCHAFMREIMKDLF